MDKSCILFSEKGDLRKNKNYGGITCTSIATKVYNALLFNCIEPKIEKKILEKKEKKISFQINQSTKITDSNNPSNQRLCRKPRQHICRFLQDIWLVGWFLWHINLCRLFNAKSIFIQIISSISNNSV